MHLSNRRRGHVNILDPSGPAGSTATAIGWLIAARMDGAGRIPYPTAQAVAEIVESITLLRTGGSLKDALSELATIKASLDGWNYEDGFPVLPLLARCGVLSRRLGDKEGALRYLTGALNLCVRLEEHALLHPATSPFSSFKKRLEDELSLIPRIQTPVTSTG